MTATNTPTPSENAAGREALGLDDQDGVALAAGQSLHVSYPYQGEEHAATLHATGEVTLGGVRYGSPSTAGRTLTGGEVNGWDRFRYVGRDGTAYRLARLRGAGGKPVGKPGRPASVGSVLRRQDRAQARARKAAARVE